MKNSCWCYKYPRCSIAWAFTLGALLGLVSGAVAIAAMARWLKAVLFLGCLTTGVGLLYGRVRGTRPWYWYAAGHAWTSYAIMVTAWGTLQVQPGMSAAATVSLTATWGTLMWLAESVACIFLAVFLWLVRKPVIRHDGPVCLKCRYSLVGNVSGRCPECGQAFEYEEAEPSVADNQL